MHLLCPLHLLPLLMLHLEQSPQSMPQKSRQTPPPKPQSPRLKLPPSNPKLHRAQSWLCAVMTAQAKNAPKPHLLAVAAMASLAISQALVVTANQAAMAGVKVVAKALRRVAHVWGMQLFARNALLWNQLKTRCVVWPHKHMAKC
jgi:sRNA-binding protein